MRVIMYIIIVALGTQPTPSHHGHPHAPQR